MEDLRFGSHAICNVNSNHTGKVTTHTNDPEKPFFIKFKKKNFSGHVETGMDTFKDSEIRNIVLSGMIKSGHYTDIHAGKFAEKVVPTT